MKRYELSESQWRKIKDMLPGRKETVGVTAKDNRTFVNGVLRVLRSGAHWKHMPAEYGNWKSAHKRFRVPSGRGRRPGSGSGYSRCCCQTVGTHGP